MPRITKKQRLTEMIARAGWQRIGEPEWQLMAATVPRLLPEDIQGLGIPVEPPWHGVAQHSLDELESSLLALSAVYAAREDLRKFCRAAVIRAKDHAKWASRSQRVMNGKRLLKAEMAEWMLVWLSDPALFPAWVPVRRQRLGALEAGV